LRIAEVRLKTIRKAPEAGLVLFCGMVRSVNRRAEEEVCEVMVPPLPIRVNTYACDNRFHTEVVQDLFETQETYGYVVVLPQEVYIAKVRGSERIVVWRQSVDLATGSRRGGQSANRISRLRDEARANLRNKVVEKCIDKLKFPYIVAGSAELPGEIRDLLVSEIRIASPCLGLLKINNIPLEEIVELGQQLVHAEDVEREKGWQHELDELLVRSPDMLVFGEIHIRECISQGLLRYILVDQGEFGEIEVRQVQFVGFLKPYGGCVGVLYYPGAANHIIMAQ